MVKGYRVIDNWSFVLTSTLGVGVTTLDVGTTLAGRIQDATVYEPYIGTFFGAVTGIEIVEIIGANATTGVISMSSRPFVGSIKDIGDRLEIRIPARLLNSIFSSDRILTNGTDVLVDQDGNVLYF